MSNLLLNNDSFGWLATFIGILFVHVAATSRARCIPFQGFLLSPDLPQPRKDADKDRPSSPTATVERFPLVVKVAIARGGRGGKQGCICSWKVTCFSSHLATSVLRAEGTSSIGIKYLGTSDQWELFSSLAKQTVGRELQITLEV